MENQRVRLSKTMLKNALIRLLQEKSIEKITVYELCGAAQINRTTFYKYYGSPMDLLKEVMRDLFAELEGYLRPKADFGLDALRRLMDYLEANQERCRVLLNSVVDRDFPERLFSLPFVQEILDQSLDGQFTQDMREYVRIFFCQGAYSIICKWLSGGCRESAGEIAALLYRLCGWQGG